MEKENKLNLVNGDIIHCSSKTLKSKIVKLLTGSKIDHSAIYTEINGFGVVADVDKKNVIRLTRFEKWKKDFDFVTSGANVSDSTKFVHSLISCEGFNFEAGFKPFKKIKRSDVSKLDFIREEIILAVFGRMEITPSELQKYCIGLDLTI